VSPKTPATSGGPDQGEAFKRISRQIDQAFEEAARLAGSALPPANFFQEFLSKVLAGISAPAGAVWIRTPQGFLQLQCQEKIETVGLDNHPNGRQSHNELLRQAFQTGRPMLLEPFSGTAILEGTPAGNPTEFVTLIAPILEDEKKPVGLVEVWQAPGFDPRAQRTFLNYLVQMAGYASQYLKATVNRQTVNQEQVWSQLEGFAANVHASLNVTEVSYTVANEGRRLVQCDRLSVAIREGRKVKIEAVSGADVVEKRSALIQLQRKLARQVIRWGEKLVYRGTPEEGLPPGVHHALDAYLAESNSKLLVVLPLYDERDKPKENPTKPQQTDPIKKARSALVMECFEPPAAVEPIIARTEVVGRHAASALYNAVELRRVPMKFIWKPIAAVQEGLGGKTRAIILAVVAGVAALVGAMIFVPYPLKLDAKGALMPRERQSVYSPSDAQVVAIQVGPGATVGPETPLILLRDYEMKKKLDEIQAMIEGAQKKLSAPEPPASASPMERERYRSEKQQADTTLQALQMQLDTLREQNNLEGQSGLLWVKAPAFDPTLGGRMTGAARPEWTVLDSPGFQEALLNRNISRKDALLHLGNRVGVWEIQLKIPQKHVGQLLEAYGPSPKPDAELDVDLVLRSTPTKTFRGKLAHKDLAREATPNRDDHNESDPVVMAYVRVSGPGIPEDMQLPREQLLSGVEVVTRIRCGTHPMGYSLFYGVWDFLYEQVFKLI
jgi:hypothetical protein